jgi:hypothetical protein
LNLQLIVAQPLPDATGYTWTLASRLGDILSRAEKLYGPRDPAYTILGVEFKDGGPQIWYPGNRNHIAIQLSVSAMDNPALACWQLAHECIHVLAPRPDQQASVLEEGLAVAFSNRYVTDQFQTIIQSGDAGYDRASELFQSAEASDPLFARNLRAAVGRFSGIRAEDISGAAPNIPSDLCLQLARPFKV